MRAVIQRVSQAEVIIKNEKEEIRESIKQGIVVFLGIGKQDNEKDLQWLVRKIIDLRIFSDDEGKMNYSLSDIKGEILVVSQFTLYADCSRGRRPDFTYAADPREAKELYNQFVFMLEQDKLTVKTGKFGADMLVCMHNDGPVTLILDTQIIFAGKTQR
ncbi:D-tyrosyl-tRNA(Tyr) deacylase [bacterium]|nr:D-tyrosyl-tRNA(Tyr) deacylase [bacterium]